MLLNILKDIHVTRLKNKQKPNRVINYLWPGVYPNTAAAKIWFWKHSATLIAILIFN